MRTSVPTLAQRQGNFSSSLGALLFLQANGSIGTTVTSNPVNVTDTNGNTMQARVGQIFRPSDHRAYAGNLIPTNTFDPIAAELLKRSPNPAASGAANNFTRIGTEDTDQDQFDIRLDHRFSDKNQIYGRFSFAKDVTSPVTPLPDGSGSITSGVTGLTDTRAQSFAANYIHAFLARRVLNERSTSLGSSEFSFTPRL